MAGKYQAPRGYHPQSTRSKRNDKASAALVTLCVTLAVLDAAAGVWLWLQLCA
mgnify:CR=1 FL=1